MSLCAEKVAHFWIWFEASGSSFCLDLDKRINSVSNLHSAKTLVRFTYSAVFILCVNMDQSARVFEKRIKAKGCKRRRFPKLWNESFVCTSKMNII